tara:strand:+ start:672 stop:908 length:237 start_codon:yes stop_codon:yes gene_type:complete
MYDDLKWENQIPHVIDESAQCCHHNIRVFSGQDEEGDVVYFWEVSGNKGHANGKEPTHALARRRAVHVAKAFVAGGGE